MSLQFRDRHVMWDSVKCFAQVQVDDVSFSSLIHQCCNPLVELHQFCQAQFALSEAMLAVTNVLLVFHVPQHSFQEDPLHDLARHRGETDWPVVPWVFFFSLFKNGGYISPFQSAGTSPDCHDFSNTMDSGLATSSASSLRICRCIPLGPMDLCAFWFLQ